MKRNTKKKNSPFTIFVFGICAALVIIGVVAVVQSITEENSKPENGSILELTPTAAPAKDTGENTETASSTVSTVPPAPTEKSNSRDGKNTGNDTKENIQKNTGSDKSGATKPKNSGQIKATKEPSPDTAEKPLTEQDATGQDNVISFDEFQ